MLIFECRLSDLNYQQKENVCQKRSRLDFIINLLQHSF